MKNHIKEIRISRGLTRAQLADLIGCSPRTIESYELGVRSPRVITLCELCVALNCNINDLLH